MNLDDAISVSIGMHPKNEVNIEEEFF